MTDLEEKTQVALVDTLAGGLDEKGLLLSAFVNRKVVASVGGKSATDDPVFTLVGIVTGFHVGIHGGLSIMSTSVGEFSFRHDGPRADGEWHYVGVGVDQGKAWFEWPLKD
jgi:hypothetical protein